MTTMPVASSGPLLLTLSVQVTIEPGGETVFVRLRSAAAVRYVAVYVAEAFAKMSCAIAPPSDHEANSYCPCGEGALMEFLDPWITVRLNGVV